MGKVFADMARKDKSRAPQSTEEEELAAACDGGRLNLRSTWVGRQWYRDMRAVATMASKWRYRAEWARRTLEELTVGRTDTEERT